MLGVSFEYVHTQTHTSPTCPRSPSPACEQWKDVTQRVRNQSIITTFIISPSRRNVLFAPFTTGAFWFYLGKKEGLKGSCVGWGSGVFLMNFELVPSSLFLFLSHTFTPLNTKSNSSFHLFHHLSLLFLRSSRVTLIFPFTSLCGFRDVYPIPSNSLSACLGTLCFLLTRAWQKDYHGRVSSASSGHVWQHLRLCDADQKSWVSKLDTFMVPTKMCPKHQEKKAVKYRKLALNAWTICNLVYFSLIEYLLI